MSSFISRMHGYCHPLPRDPPQDKCPDPRKTWYLKRFGLKCSGKCTGTSEMMSAALKSSKINKNTCFLEYYCQECQATRKAPCTAKFSCSPRQPVLRKSGMAVGEITFENAVKNSIANSSAAPTDFIFLGTCGIFSAGGLFFIFHFSKSTGSAPRSFTGRMLLPPKKPHIWKDRVRNALAKKGTP